MKEKLMGFIEVVVVISIIVGIILLLDITNKKGMERCVGAGYSESYCREGLR